MSPGSHFHVKTRPVRPTSDSFHEIEWDAAVSWQLHGQHSCYWANVGITGSMWMLMGQCGC